MAQIEPFKGIRYNRKKIADLSKVIAPPYDVISPAELKAYYRAHKANITRLLLSQSKKGDSPSNNKRAIPINESPTAIQILLLIFFLKPIQAINGTIIVFNPVINPPFPAVVNCNPYV